MTVTLRTVAPALVFAAKQGFRKIADKAKEAKTQFDEHRRVEKESALSQTERRLDALRAQLEEKEAILAAKERTLQDEESRLRRLSRRPMYVLLFYTLAYGTLAVMVLAHYDLVASEESSPDRATVIEAQPERQTAQEDAKPSPSTNSLSERESSSSTSP